MKDVKFPVVIKDGNSLITFTDAETATTESGAVFVSSLADMMYRVESGKAVIVVTEEVGEIFITHTGLELVPASKYFAYFEGGQFEISPEAKLNIDWSLKTTGRYVVSRQWFDLFTGEKYEY